jgi:hypothetical protein
MPKESKKSRSSGRVQGPAFTWPPEKRLEYHVAECAMHLQMIKTIVDNESDTFPDSLKEEIGKHKKQAGLRLKLINHLLAKKFPAIMKSP